MDGSRETFIPSDLVTGIALIAADPALTLLQANDAYYRLVGRTPEVYRRHANSIRALVPPRLGGKIHAFLTETHPDYGYHEGFFIHADGTVVHLHVTLTRLGDRLHQEQYAVYHFVFTPVQGQQLTPSDFKPQQPQYTILSTSAQDISFEYDFATDTMFYGEGYEAVFDRPGTIPQFREHALRAPSGSIDACFKILLFNEEGREVSELPEFQVLTRENVWCWFSVFCTTLRDEHGQHFKAVGALRNIDGQKQEQLRLLDQARTDPMTGLCNKATTEEKIRAALSRVSLDRMGVLMMIDIDNFKDVNDTLGHLAGDSIIIHTARQMRALFHKEDIIGRVGGDEFHVYMADVPDPAVARKKAETLCASIKELFRAINPDAPISVSVGIAVAQKPEEYDELYQQADIALYHAKSNGKDRYELYGCPASSAGCKPAQKTGEVSLGSLRNSIPVDVIDMLFSAPHIQDGIENVLSFLGTVLRVSRIRIFETSFNHTSHRLTHEWKAEGAASGAPSHKSLPPELLALPCNSGADGLFYCSDAATLPADQKSALLKNGITALLWSSIEREGTILGYVGFEEHCGSRIWSRQEVDTLLLLSKLLAEHIRQKHSTQLLRKHHKATRTILNCLSTASVYVISRGKHKLLYFNDTVRRLFPGVRLGMTCHEAFWNKSKVCDFCPARMLGNKESITSVFYDTPFGKIVDVSISSLVWKRQEPAMVVLLSEHLPTKEEAEAKKRKEAFSHALCAIYDYVEDIDPQTGACEILAVTGQDLLDAPASGRYEDMLLARVEKRVVPAFRPDVLRAFSLHALQQAFAQGQSAVEMEYQVQVNGGEPRWKRRCACPYRLEDGGAHILVWARDVTEQKKEEERKEQDKKAYRLALQSSYAEMHELDLETRRLRRIYTDNTLRREESEEGQRPAALWDPASGIHPEDAAGCREFYDPDALQSRLERRENLTREYRRLGQDNAYRWISASLVPLGTEPHKVLILLKDVTARKRLEAETRRLEVRYTTLFRQSCDAILEVNLKTGTYARTIFAKDYGLSMPDRKTYAPAFQALLEKKIHPLDAPRLRDAFSLEALRRACENGASEAVCQYRSRSETMGAYIWLEARGLFIHENDGETAFILIRNISAQKCLEEERSLEEQRYNIALQNTYSEIYALDLDTNRPRLLYSNTDALIPLDLDPQADIHSIVPALLHPDDQDTVLNSFRGNLLRAAFAQGQEEISGEYRRKGRDGQYYWTSTLLVPVMQSKTGDCRQALIFIKDITEGRKQKQQQRVMEQYDRALRSIYDELYELNVTRNSYRIVYHVENKYVTPPEAGALDAAIAQVASEMIHPEDKKRFLEFFDLSAVRASFAAGRDSLIGEFRKLWADGRFHWASLTLFPITSAEKNDETYLVFIMDIERKKQAEELAQHTLLLERQRLDDARYKAIIEQTDTLVFEWQEDTGQCYVSPEIPARFAGAYENGDVLQVWREEGVLHSEDRPRLHALIQDMEGQKKYGEMTVRLRKRDGQYIWCKVALTCLSAGPGTGRRVIGTINDVDGATRSILALKYRAEFDMLTGIYNAQTFYAKTEQLLHKGPDTRRSIVRMDIDRFKVINDVHGIHEGDRLLRAIAALLKEKVNGHGTYGRIGGDVFCMCVDFDQERIVRLIGEITEALAAYPLPYKIVPSFGICAVSARETPVNVLCDWANLALKTVKGNYLKRYAFYDGTLREKILEEKRIESRMHDALLNGQFVLYFQPQINIATGKIIGAEALVRWKRLSGAIIPPDRFIPLFEKNGFIVQLDKNIWEQACIQIRVWMDQGFLPFPISVNVSRVHFHGTRLCEELTALVNKHRISPRLLKLELTETAFLENQRELREIMRKLQGYGFSFSMDDFGSGYSSLNMLKSLPIDAVKIDREFLSQSVATEHGRTIIRHTIAMAKEMSMQVIAEGVETQDQAAFLLQSGCQFAQGYYYAPPVPHETFEKMAFSLTTPFPPMPEIPEPGQGL